MIRHIQETEFNEEVLKSEGIVVVDFYATWCGPCKMLAPVLEQVQEEREDIKIVKVDIDQNSNLAKQYGVRSVPTIKVFKNGEESKTKIGFMNKTALVELVEL